MTDELPDDVEVPEPDWADKDIPDTDDQPDEDINENYTYVDRIG